jgi:hypothetical protein
MQKTYNDHQQLQTTILWIMIMYTLEVKKNNTRHMVMSYTTYQKNKICSTHR